MQPRRVKGGACIGAQEHRGCQNHIFTSYWNMTPLSGENQAMPAKNSWDAHEYQAKHKDVSSDIFNVL